jgi:hypothetical protein
MNSKIYFFISGKIKNDGFSWSRQYKKMPLNKLTRKKLIFKRTLIGFLSLFIA